MNRRNLLIVAAILAILAAVVSSIGHARYGHWGEQETFYFQQEHQYSQQATAAKAANDTVARSVDIDMTVEWSQKREAARAVRLTMLRDWNIAAAIVAGVAGLFVILWFITLPKRSSIKGQFAQTGNFAS